MNEIKLLHGTLGGFAKYFYQIKDNLEIWSFDEKTGIGFFKKYTGHYAHVELKICKLDKEYRRNNVEYLINENQLPQQLRIEIEKTLNFFISYVEALKGEEVSLGFKITDATYHKVDTRRRDVIIGTIYALLNCFGKKIGGIQEDDVELIQKLKTESLKKK
ncbi:hypothetical protein [Neptunitalea lumnitzerae]|uniref:Phage protein n=1 Tax=Neptunitalea lumnitzerae TaxID=2965509 RepID=A0ABQ5MH48_9FLAO|nr:hypothetical protein [Neptunitalea sp. Y10]GLB48739.1 hypothetical protein Y10_11070 [Neptunitalea sp. Y10]